MILTQRNNNANGRRTTTLLPPPRCRRNNNNNSTNDGVSSLLFVRIVLWLSLLQCYSWGDSLATTTTTTTSIRRTTTTSTTSDEAATTSTSTDSIWKDIERGPADAILGIAQSFRECTDPRKVNVCVGAYRTNEGSPWVLPSVRRAEEMLLSSDDDNKEYLPIEGDVDFIRKALTFAYGNGNGNDDNIERIAGVQTLSGTGACRIGGEFLARYLPGRTIYIPVPTWTNHWKIFKACGMPTAAYRYYDRCSNKLDLNGLLEDLTEAPEGSIILLHACAHNPTGCDPTAEQWEDIIDVLKRKKHVCFFDSAYQGFASGNAERDAGALRRVVSEGSIPVLLAQSFAKNFGLYGERCGTLSVVCGSPDEADRIVSQLRTIIRPMYSSPPRRGSSIVKTILGNEELRAQYERECASMAKRIGDTRRRLVEKLRTVGSKHDWSHVRDQIGMFAYTGMNEDMCDALTKEYAIYLTRDGRISIAGLNDSNLDYVAKAIHDVTDGKSITTPTS